MLQMTNNENCYKFREHMLSSLTLILFVYLLLNREALSGTDQRIQSLLVMDFWVVDLWAIKCGHWNRRANKLALLWGEAQLCLCLKKRKVILYSYIMINVVIKHEVTCSDPKENYCYPKSNFTNPKVTKGEL